MVPSLITDASFGPLSRNPEMQPLSFLRWYQSMCSSCTRKASEIFKPCFCRLLVPPRSPGAVECCCDVEHTHAHTLHPYSLHTYTRSLAHSQQLFMSWCFDIPAERNPTMHALYSAKQRRLIMTALLIMKRNAPLLDRPIRFHGNSVFQRRRSEI
jgi:hypothetical protein